MSEQLDALDGLIEAVEGGDVQRHRWQQVLGIGDIPFDAAKAYLGSLDAAKALHDALLPQKVWEIGEDNVRLSSFASINDGRLAFAETPSCAWLLAILRAYRSTLTDTSNGGE